MIKKFSVFRQYNQGDNTDQMSSYKKKLIRIVFLAILMTTLSLCVQAQRFWKIGTRALGMGGAYVAAADDSLSAYWNPAGVSFFQRYDLSFSYGTLAQQEGKLINIVNDIVELDIKNAKAPYDDGALSSAVEHLKSLSQEGINASGNVQMGFFSSGGSWGASVLEWQGALIRPGVDLTNIDLSPDSPNFIKNNTSYLHSQGIKGREYILTLAYPILISQLIVGFNLKYMQLYTYQTDTLILTSLENTVKARSLVVDTFEEPLAYGKGFSFDFGVLAELTPHLRIGLVGKNFRKPTFQLDNEEELQLNAQWRSGIAITPNPSTIISVDFDLTKNKWIGDDLEFRELAAGFEKWISNYRFAIRGGGCYNLNAKEGGLVYTGGGSVRMSTLFIDFAIAYQPHLNDFSFCLGSSVKF